MAHDKEVRFVNQSPDSNTPPPFRKLLFCTILICVLSTPVLAQEPVTIAVKNRPAPVLQEDNRPIYVADEIVIRYREGAGPEDSGVLGVAARHDLTLIKHNPWIGYHRYGLPEGLSVAQAIRSLRVEPTVETVEPNYYYYLHAIPNDSFYQNYNGQPNDLQRWYFNGVGADRNLDAEAAWDVTTGRPDVVIAVSDTGVDLDHPDLAANIWTNPGEIAGNSIDDDGNGFVDDVNGWDFWSNDNDPNPDLGDGIDNDGNGAADDGTFHGSFSASCAANVTNNATGAAGASWNCSIMALKIFTDDGGAFTTDIADSITYAANNGADVINMSFGGPFSSTVQSAVNFAWGQGLVQVASAGNSNSSAQQFPASLNHVISVGASDSASVLGGGSGDIDGRASFSQYGPAAVDVVAPGVHLIGATVNSVADGSPGTPTYFIASGTSFSGPTVAGLAGLVISRARDLATSITNDEVENIIQNTANDMPDDPGDSPNGGSTWDNFGRVDFQAAVDAVTGGPPGNQPPVANAGPDQSADTGDPVTFNGTGSFDPDSGPSALTYSWDFGDGSPDGSGSVVNHSYAAAGPYTVTLTVDDGADIDTDVAQVTISDPPPPGGGRVIYFASAGNQSYAGIGTMRNEDVVAYDEDAGTFSQYFDGSDVGLGSAAMDGLVLLAGGDLLISLTASFNVPGVGTADDSDIVQFTPSSLGPSTSGVFTLFFDGSDVGLTTNGEDIDAIGVSSDGKLVISTVGGVSATGASGADEDLLIFTATSFGPNTSGSFALHFDGSDVGLGGNSSHDVNAAHPRLDDSIYLSTIGSFVVPGASGSDEDIFLFTPGTLGNSTSGTFSPFLDSSTVGVPTSADIYALFILE